MHAGSATYPWAIFAGVISWLREYDADLSLNVMGEIGPIPVLERTFDGPALCKDYNESKLPGLLNTLVDTRICKTTLAVDKIYSVPGMVCEEDRNRIKVDYSLEVAEVFQQVAIDELNCNGLGVLGLCVLPSKKPDLKCPSWVPDLAQPLHHKSLTRLGYRSSAAGSTVPSFRL